MLCTTHPATVRIGVAGFGTVGRTVVERLISDPPPYISLVGITAADISAAAARAAAAGLRVPVLTLPGLIEASDWIVEVAAPAAFRSIAAPVLLAGRSLIVCSTTGLLIAPDLIDLARERGARIWVPSCSLPGIDGVVAAAQGHIESAKIVTRKPPGSLSPALRSPESVPREATCLFSGTVREAARRFPANVNVAATLALAGLGPDATLAEVWMDPGVDRNTHRIEIVADSTRFVVEAANVPDPLNPRTGRLTALGILACIRKIRSTLVLGI